MREDAKKARWERERDEWFQARRKAWGGFAGLTNRMLDSAAYQSLRSVHSVKVITWFWGMAEYPKGKRRQGQESPIGNLKKILNNGKISFTYQVARYRGMRADQFSRALRELFKYGFIDITEHGRGVKGEYTKFALSDRWKSYDTPTWEEIPFPRTYRAGFTSEQYKQRRSLEHGTKKVSYANAELQTPEKRSYEVPEADTDSGIAELKTDVSVDHIATQTSSLLRSTRGYRSSAVSSEKDLSTDLKDQGVDCDRGRRAKTSKQWRAPKTEIRENIVEILSRRPDERAGNNRFISFLLDQLLGFQRQRLDAERVYRELLDQHGLDEWTVDLLFAVSTIDIPTQEDVVH